MAQQTVTVLVCHKERRRPIKLIYGGSHGDLEAEVRAAFSDLIDNEETLLLQIKDETWQGLFVDIALDQAIPDRSVIQVIVVDRDAAASSSNKHHQVLSLCLVIYDAVIELILNAEHNWR